MKTIPWVLLLLMPAAALGEPDWERFREQSVIEILTTDEDGAVRETKVWIVVLDGRGYVRTNDSRWLANIRRGSEVVLRLDGESAPVDARETDDAGTAARVEESFKDKYGLLQRLMSAFRMKEPTVLELTPR